MIRPVLVSMAQGTPSNLTGKKVARARARRHRREKSLAFSRVPRLIDVAISPEFN